MKSNGCGWSYLNFVFKEFTSRVRASWLSIMSSHSRWAFRFWVFSFCISSSASSRLRLSVFMRLFNWNVFYWLNIRFFSTFHVRLWSKLNLIAVKNVAKFFSSCQMKCVHVVRVFPTTRSVNLSFKYFYLDSPFRFALCIGRHVVVHHRCSLSTP